MSRCPTNPVAPLFPRRMVAWVTLVAMLCVLGPLGCGERASARREGPMRIVVSLAPLAGIVRALAPEADVRVLVPAGASEHGYELTSGDVATVGRADLVVGVGLGLEPRLQSLLRGMATEGPPAVWFESVLGAQEGSAESAGHEHAPGRSAEGQEGSDDHADAGPPRDSPPEGHGHGLDDGHGHGVDPHLWLDPSLVDRFVPMLASAMRGASAGTASPIAADEMDRRVRALRDKLAAADARWRATLEPLRGRAMVTHHASHGRFADHFGLRVAGVIRLSELQEPTSGQVQDVVARIKAEHVPAIFVEPQFDATTATRIAEVADVRVVVLDPLGDGDWFALMDSTVRSVAEALGAPAAVENLVPLDPGHERTPDDPPAASSSHAPALPGSAQR